MSDLVDALVKALAASPDNVALRLTLVKQLDSEGDAAFAWATADGLRPDDLDDAADRVVLARLDFARSPTDGALRWLDDAPECQIQRARMLLELDRQSEARTAYDAAVAGNAALEDLDLAARLTAKVTVLNPDKGPRLTVYATDDTDDTELTRLLAPAEAIVTFADVGGLDAVKRTITRKIILPYTKPSLFQRFKKKVGGGILLYGPPGCGKTLLARATAGEVNAEFFSIAVADVLDLYIGESERKLHALFDKARSNTPAVMFFDEIEALGAKRSYSREGTSSKLVSQFLSEMDGFAQNNAGVLVLGATNVPWALDPAFRRPGRFDRVVFIPPPDEAARREILAALLAERPTAVGVDPGVVAARTSGFSGADLAEIVETAADLAIEESIDSEAEVDITMQHLKDAFDARQPTTLEWLTTARNYARYANEGGQYDDVLAFLKKHGR